jgi:hypothetical protein
MYPAVYIYSAMYYIKVFVEAQIIIPQKAQNYLYL